MIMPLRFQNVQITIYEKLVFLSVSVRVTAKCVMSLSKISTFLLYLSQKRFFVFLFLKQVNYIFILVWPIALGKRGRKRGKANFFCKHPEFSKWIVKDKQKATLGTACSHHHHCQITLHALFFFFIFIQISFSCKNMVLAWVYEAISSNWHEFLEIL